MPKIEVSQRFLQAYHELPPEVQVKVKKALRLLAENPRHPSLQAKPIQGAPGIYEARIDRRYRLTYARLPGDILQIRVIGAHDDALNNP
jgi:mRNA-degrading endonuclease RelE of RelBE toxin-antitoxin system